MVPLIHELPQLDSIYFFSDHQTTHQPCVSVSNKVKGIFNTIEPICHRLKRNIQQYRNTLLSISTVTSTDISNGNVDQLDQSFMYSQLIQEILLELDYNDKAKADLANYCRRRQASDGVGIVSPIIDEFEQDYERHSPIWWYTRDCFLYVMLNQALRTQDTEALIKMGFVIRDIHRKIKHLHDSATPMRLTVYRGQCMSADEFTKIQKNKGGLLSFNNFLSASTDRDIAYFFADSTLQNRQMMSILFQIEIEPIVSSTAFTELKGENCSFDSEKEILFSMHSIFRIGEIKQIQDRFWNVELKLTSDNDRDLAHLTEQLRQEIKGATAWYRLGHLLAKMGKFNQAEEVLLKLLDSTPNLHTTAISSITHQLGVIHREKGNFQTALMFYDKALIMHWNDVPIDFESIAITCNDIGLVHRELGNYLRALAYYQKALDFLEDPSINSNRLQLATAYNNVGQVFQSMGDYSTALGFFRRTLTIEKEVLPSNHPALGIVQNNIGAVHSLMGNHTLALESYQETFRIEDRSLPTDHGTLAVTYNNLGEAHRSNGDYETALEYYQKAIDIGERSLSLNHPSIATAYYNKGLVYHMKHNRSTALKFYERACEIFEQTVSPSNLDLAIVYEHIGQVHVGNEDPSRALEFFRKALKIQETCLSPNDLHLARTYVCTATAFYSLGDHPSAFEYVQRAIDIARQETTPAAKEVLQMCLQFRDAFRNNMSIR
jgi:tetratricopeptide (TPR) repeat protein